MYRRKPFGRHRGWFFWWFIPLFFLGPAHWWWGWGNAVFSIMLSVFLIALLAWGLSFLFAEEGPAAGQHWPMGRGMWQQWQQPPQRPQGPSGPAGMYQAPYSGEQEQRYHQGYRAQTGPRPNEVAGASSQGAQSATGRPQPQYEEPQVEYPLEEPPLVQ
uniref:Uncharacterized protein n=1 Tax=Thermogemmatispora argillosa TaxID=2045280 RepID=A0A455T6D7_9CHLR|nr:hypothetical protein KTA_33280 [Thermogemmatispora argillosa]